jgi:hypothetical protein
MKMKKLSSVSLHNVKGSGMTMVMQAPPTNISTLQLMAPSSGATLSSSNYIQSKPSPTPGNGPSGGGGTTFSAMF